MFFLPLRIFLLVSILFSPISTLAQNDNSSPLQGIFPPLTPFINYGNLIIAYESSRFILQGNTNSGVEATPNDTSTAPKAISITPFGGYGNPFLPINTTQLYTLVMIDPDTPSLANPTTSQILHFVQTGLRITISLAKTSESMGLRLTATVPPVVPYRGPAPPVDTGLHRYIFLLFMQPDDNIDLGSFSADNRRNFDVQNFARNNTFGPPLAGAYFQAQNAANSGNNTVPEKGTTMEEFMVYDPAVDGPLVIDTSIPTPPAWQTSDPYPIATEIEIPYKVTFTYSFPSITVSVELPGQIGDWTMTAPAVGPITVSMDLPSKIRDWTMTTSGRMSEEVTVTTTTEAPVPTLEVDTSSVLTLRRGSDNSASIVGIPQAGTEGPSTKTPSWLDGPILDNSAVRKSAGVTILVGILAGGTVYLTSIL